MEEKAKRSMRKPAAKPAAKKPMAKSGAKDMSSKLTALRKENRELKAQLKGSGAKKGAGDMGKKESMKDRMERLRNMRKKK
jgi:hypothetical protein